MITSRPILNPLCRFFLAACLAVPAAIFAAEAEVESAPIEESRSLVVFIDKPVLLVEGQEPEFPAVPQILSIENDVEGVEQLQSINQFASNIQSLENQGGVWNGELVETLASLGNLHQQLQNHTQALATFDRALHLSRINNGLNTEDQIPIVNEIIESHLVMGNWEQADLYHDYLFYVQQKSYGASDPRIIPVLEEMGNWNMRAFSIGFGDLLGVRLGTAQLVFNAAAQLVDSHFGRSDERFITYMHSVASSAFQVARHPSLIAEMDKPAVLETQEEIRRFLNAQGNLLPTGFRKGESALQEIIEYYEEAADAYVLAEAKANLADWYLIFDRRRDAEALYLEAWNLLAEESNGEVLQQQLFGTVQPIPTFDRTPRRLNLRGSERPDRGQLEVDYGDLQFQLSRWGEARRITVIDENGEEIEETAENAGQLRRVARELRSIRFRPKLLDGVPVSTEDNRVRIRFWY